MERSPKNIGWFAGLVEGEGSIGWHGGKQHGESATVTVAMTDPDVLDKARKLTGGALYGPYFPPSRGDNIPIYRLHLLGKRAIGWMLTIYLLMGSRRQAQIQSVVSEWRTKPPYSERTKKSWITRRRKYGVRGHR